MMLLCLTSCEKSCDGVSYLVNTVWLDESHREEIIFRDKKDNGYYLVYVPDYACSCAECSCEELVIYSMDYAVQGNKIRMRLHRVDLISNPDAYSYIEGTIEGDEIISDNGNFVYKKIR